MSNPKKRHLSRARKRGAALVEAAVAIPVMLVFLGTTMFVHKSYDTKLAQQTGVRAEVLYNASHNCDETAPAEMSNQLGGTSSGTNKSTDQAPSEDGEEATRGATKLRDSEKQGVSRSWNLVKSHRSGPVNGSAVQDRQKLTWQRTVTADGEVACNEKRFDNDWTAIFGFIKEYAQSGGGFL